MIKINAELQAATTLKDTETLVGKINTSDFDMLTLWCDYVKGDESYVRVIPYVSRVEGGDKYQLGYWADGNVRIYSKFSFQTSTSGKYYILMDVKGIEFISIYAIAVGGTPTGTLKVGYTLGG